MDPRDACLRVLREAAPETLHWTVVLDRALKARLVSPFTDPDVRGSVQRALAGLAREGAIVRDGKGFYRLPGGDANADTDTGAEAGPDPAEE
jgi:hypothetical protein